MPRKRRPVPASSSASENLAEAATLFALAAEDRDLQQSLARVAGACVRTLQKGGRILVCGNGGSASQATHFAGELVGPFLDRKRPAFAAIPLGFDTGSLTAVANDFGYEAVFARQIEALGRKGDVLWALSTSGGSPNILAALKQARKQGLRTVLFSGHGSSPAQRWAGEVLRTPPAPVPRVQELHLAYGHWLCQRIEACLVKRGAPRKR